MVEFRHSYLPGEQQRIYEFQFAGTSHFALTTINFKFSGWKFIFNTAHYMWSPKMIVYWFENCWFVFFFKSSWKTSEKHNNSQKFEKWWSSSKTLPNNVFINNYSSYKKFSNYGKQSRWSLRLTFINFFPNLLLSHSLWLLIFHMFSGFSRQKSY